MGNNDIKVKDLSTTSSLSTDNKLMLLTDGTNNRVQNITIENALANIISSNANNSLSVGSDKKLYTRDISSEVGDLDNLITTNKTNIVSAINEVKGDTKAITGEVVSASKGWLEEGKIYQKAYWYGEKIYNDVYSYNHSTFDVSKFTVVGSPIITDDGIASGLTTSDYISIDTSNIDFSTANSWEIDFFVKLNNSTSTTEMYFDTYDVGINSIIRFDYYNPNNENAFRLMINSTDNTRIFNYETIKNNIVTNTWYKFKLIYTGTHYIVKDANGNILKDVESNKKVELTSRILVGKRQANDQPLTNGSIDLKAFSITVNSYPVFNGNKTGIDTIKPADYTIVGTPIISADGIASGFDSSNYINYVTADILNGKSWKIVEKVYWDGASTTVYLKTADNNSYLRINATGTMSYNAYDTNNTQIWVHSATVIFGSAGWYYIGVRYDYSTGTFTTMYGIDLDTMTDYATATKGANVQLRNLNNSHYININSNCTIDLSTLKIYANDNLIYQPCLLIPYNESSTGSKIVDVAYRDRVIDVYEQYGSANYYTIDETNQNATLPMGEIYGFIEQTKEIFSVPAYGNQDIGVVITGDLTYTCPDDGYIYCNNIQVSAGGGFELTILRNGQITQSSRLISFGGASVDASVQIPFIYPVIKGDVVQILWSSTSGTYPVLNFVHKEGV